MKRIAMAVLLASSAAAFDAPAACLETPASSGIITSVYGWRYHPVYKRWRLHRGVDLRAPMSTPLKASHSGVVQISHSNGGGNELRIIGDDGTVTRYLHLTRATVDPGTRVSAGEEVALSGNTGHASAAPHLHFEVYKKGGSGDVNPEPLLCPSPARKAGADSSNGFPVQACNPDGGQCGGGGAVPAAGTPATGGVQTQTASAAPAMEAFDDMSTAEIFASEAAKRFTNPDWYREQAEKTTVPLMIEYVHMEALGQYIAFHKVRQRERVEALLAARLARNNKQEMDLRLARQRETAAKAK